MLISIFAITKAILFPNTQIIVAAGQKSQAKEVIEKISSMLPSSPNLRREISHMNINGADPVIEFHNGSWIRTVAAHDGSRGKRSNLLIVDEYRMVPLEIINTVLRKFQSAPRYVGFIEKEPYASLSLEEKATLQDRNQEVYLSSAWYKSHESWDRVIEYAEKMAQGSKYFVCQLPYQLAVKEGLLNVAQIRDEMNEASFRESMWEMEMNAFFWGEHENSYFSYKEVEKNRSVRRVYYPKNITDRIGDTKVKPPKKQPGEIRIISADIASMSKASNDASVFTIGRLIPTKTGYDRSVIYMEDKDGGHITSQALRIRELYEDFDCDYIVLDTVGVGLGVYDQLTVELLNTETGEVYEPLSCMNNEELAERCAYPNAPKVIYSIHATATLNENIAATFKASLKEGKISFPVHESEADDTLNTIRGYDKLSKELRAELISPYIQTTLMTDEVINLEQDYTSTGSIRLKEQRGKRKDRYSSVSYLNYFANEFEVKHRRATPKKSYSISDYFMAVPPKLY